jgi:RNA polymerase sigma-70 factor, ECF subfamily
LASEVNVLISRCLDGQQSAFSELIKQYQGMVYGLCLRMLRQREEAEDATQETFVRVCNSLHQWDPTRAFEPWLLTIAGNRCRTRLAKRSRRPGHVSLDYPIQDATHLEFEASHLAEEIDTVLESLKSDCKRAFLLFYNQQLAYNEIAARLQVPLGTVKTWVHRARKELVEKLRFRGTLDVRN